MIIATDKQVIDAIRYYWKHYGYSPSYKDLLDLTGLKSKQSIYTKLHRLKRDGLVNFVDSQPRTITVVGDTIEYKEG